MTKPKIALDSLLRAAWRQHLAGALPVPPGTSLDSILEAGGMRPWLREALGSDAARDLERDGLGGSSLATLLGLDSDRDARLYFDASHLRALLAVDAACEAATCDAWTLALRLRDLGGPRMARHLDSLVGRVAAVAARRGPGSRVPGQVVVGRVIRHVALLEGISLSGPHGATPMVPFDAVEEATIVAVWRPASGHASSGLPMPTYVLEAADGHRWSFHDRLGSLDAQWRHAYVGAKADVSLRGLMPGFRGYPAAVDTRGYRARPYVREEGRSAPPMEKAA